MSQQQYIRDVCCSTLPNTSEYHKIRAMVGIYKLTLLSNNTNIHVAIQTVVSDFPKVTSKVKHIALISVAV